MSDATDPLTTFVGGDQEGARSLRRALEALRGSDIPPSLAAQVTAVLDGRMEMRDFARLAEVREIADRGLERLRVEMDAMTPAARADLVRDSALRAAESDPDQRANPRDPAEP